MGRLASLVPVFEYQYYPGGHYIRLKVKLTPCKPFLSRGLTIPPDNRCDRVQRVSGTQSCLFKTYNINNVLLLFGRSKHVDEYMARNGELHDVYILTVLHNPSIYNLYNCCRQRQT